LKIQKIDIENSSRIFLRTLPTKRKFFFPKNLVLVKKKSNEKEKDFCKEENSVIISKGIPLRVETPS
jgi:hypothetical protein